MNVSLHSYKQKTAAVLAALTIGAGLGIATPALCANKIDLSGLPPKTVIDTVPPREVPEWVKSNCRPSHLPPPDWKLVEAHLKAGVSSLCANMDSRFCRVGPSAYLYKPEAVKDADETMRKFVEMTHAAGAKAIFYVGPMHVPSWQPEFKAAHPDWLRVDAQGKPGDLGNPRSGYGDWLVEQLAYVVRTYKIDGFWFDGYSGWQYSYDPISMKSFSDFSGGKKIPERLMPDDPVSQQYLKWYFKEYIDFADRIRGAIRKENPNAVLFVNYSACREWYQNGNFTVEYPAAYATAIDMPSLEQYWDTPGDAINQQFIAAFNIGAAHNRGGAVWAQPSSHGTVGLCPEVELRLRYLLGATWGIYTEFVEPIGRPEYLDMWAKDMKCREEWMKKSEPVSYIGIVASEQTKMHYGQKAPLANYFSHTLGAFKAAMETHLPVQVLTEYDLESGDLQVVKVLVLPDVACLSDRAAEVIRRFVKNGGGLVASYESSLYDETGAKRANFALADVFRADYIATRLALTREAALPLYVTSKHAIVDDPIIERGGYTSCPVKDALYGTLWMIASATEVSMTGGEAIFSFREKPSAATNFPGAIASTFGKGRVVFFPTSVDKAFFFYPEPYLRQMLYNAYQWAAGSASPVEVKAPTILAVTYRSQPDKHRLVVHLLNDASSWGRHSIYQKITADTKEFADPGHPQSPDLRGTWPVRDEVIPIHDIKVICRQTGFTKATLQPEGIKLPLKKVNGAVEVMVPKVELHSMVVFE